MNYIPIISANFHYSFPETKSLSANNVSLLTLISYVKNDDTFYGTLDKYKGDLVSSKRINNKNNNNNLNMYLKEEEKEMLHNIFVTRNNKKAIQMLIKGCVPALQKFIWKTINVGLVVSLLYINNNRLVWCQVTNAILNL